MTRLEGVVTPLLTPFEDSGEIAGDLWLQHAQWLLAEGASYLSPFGTTGEAMSVSGRARMNALEVLIDGGVPANRLVPGTGLCSLDETEMLTRHARELGCAGVMTLPPFFYTGASEDGLFGFFARLIERESALPIVLYHIPSHAGVGISPSLAARLSSAFPDIVTGYKDSSGDWSNTQAVIGSAPGLGVFPGSEAFLSQGLNAGGVGCISATCNINVGQIRRLYDGILAGENTEDLDAEVKSVRKTVQGAGLIPAMKALLSNRLREPRWLNVLAPLVAPDPVLGKQVNGALGRAVEHIAA